MSLNLLRAVKLLNRRRDVLRPSTTPSYSVSQVSATPASAEPSGSRESSLARVSKSSLSAREAKALLPSYLAGTVRSSTKKSYEGYWKKYKSFCQVNNLNISKAESISTFLIVLAENSKGTSAPLLAKHAIKFHLKLLYPFKRCLTDSWYVSSILKTVKKKFSRPAKKAKILHSKVILSLVSSWLSTGDFKDKRSAVFILMQFLLFARYEEVAKLKKSNIRFLESGDIEVSFDQAKNYNMWDCKSSCIAQNADGGFDPVQIIRSYIEDLCVSNSQWLFPNFRKGKKKALVYLDSHVSFDNMLKLLRQGLDGIGEKGILFTLHSVRTGAVSEATNSGECDRESIKRHVRWASVEMVDHYYKLSLEKRLQPSLSLDIYKL